MHWDMSPNWFHMGSLPQASTFSARFLELVLGTDVPLGGLIWYPRVGAFQPSVGIPATASYRSVGPVAPRLSIADFFSARLLVGNMSKALELRLDLLPLFFGKWVILLDDEGALY